MRGDADQVKGHVSAGHQSNFPIHVGFDEVAQIFFAAAPSPFVVESVAYAVVVAVAESVLVAVTVIVVFVETVFDAEVPVAAAPVVVIAVPAVAAVVESLSVAASAAFAVAPVPVVAEDDVENLSVHCNSNLARSDCPELPDSNLLPSSAWAVQKLTERVVARNSQWWTVHAAVDLTFQAFVSAEKLAAVPNPCPGQVWSCP